MTVADLLKVFGGDLGGPHFVPAGIASTIGVWVIPPRLSETFLPRAASVVSMKTPDKLALAAGIAVVLGLLFRILGLTQIRFYEGYLGPEFVLGFMRRRQQSGLEEAQKQRDDIQQIPREQRTPEQAVSLLRLATKLQTRTAPGKSFTLPTKLGNVYRAMEGYPNDRYGFDGVTMWPRLHPLLPDNVRQNCDNARGHVDLLLTSCTLGFLYALILLVLGPHTVWGRILVLCIGAIAYGFYRMSLVAAVSLGSATRAAFDIGREKLLAVWGYKPPSDMKSEHQLWDEITGFVQYGEELKTQRTVGGVASRTKPEDQGDQNLCYAARLQITSLSLPDIG